MRLTVLNHLQAVEAATGDPALCFRGARGEDFRLTVLDHDLIRVQHHPEGRPRLDRTWLVAGKDGAFPLEGRPRDDVSCFACPPFGTPAGSSLPVWPSPEPPW